MIISQLFDKEKVGAQDALLSDRIAYVVEVDKLKKFDVGSRNLRHSEFVHQLNSCLI